MGFFDELKRLAQPYGEDEDEFFDKGTQQEEVGPPIAPTERRESFFTDEEEAEPGEHQPAEAKFSSAEARRANTDEAGGGAAGGPARAGGAVGLHAREAKGV